MSEANDSVIRKIKDLATQEVDNLETPMTRQGLMYGGIQKSIPNAPQGAIVNNHTSNSIDVEKLVHIVEQTSRERNLATDGVALYHILAPMFLGRSAQALRLCYRSAKKETNQKKLSEETESNASPMIGSKPQAGFIYSTEDPLMETLSKLVVNKNALSTSLSPCTTKETAPNGSAPLLVCDYDAESSGNDEDSSLQGTEENLQSPLEDSSTRIASNDGLAIVETSKIINNGNNHQLDPGLCREIDDLITELITVHKLPREVIIFALYTHSGNVERAHKYLLARQLEDVLPEWSEEQDLLVLQGDTQCLTTKYPNKSIEDISDRSSFLNRFCDAPIVS